MWKWACFRSGANSEPLSRRLQPGIRFFHDPIPPRPTGRLAASLPTCRSTRAGGGAYHVPWFADSAVVIRGACPFRVCLSRGCNNNDVLSASTRASWQRAFWLWPDSRFGHSLFTRVQSTVHWRYPCGTRLVPRPPSRWQSPCTPSRVMHATDVGDVVGWASHRPVAGPACHPRQLLVVQQVTAMTCVMCDKAIQDIAALSKKLLSVLGTLHDYH
jgi:hypothetical protein